MQLDQIFKNISSGIAAIHVWAIVGHGLPTHLIWIRDGKRADISGPARNIFSLLAPVLDKLVNSKPGPMYFNRIVSETVYKVARKYMYTGLIQGDLVANQLHLGRKIFVLRG